MLVVLALWRHVYRRFLRYDLASHWAPSFLGMYAVGTHELIEAMDFPLRFRRWSHVALAARIGGLPGLLHTRCAGQGPFVTLLHA